MLPCLFIHFNKKRHLLAAEIHSTFVAYMLDENRRLQICQDNVTRPKEFLSDKQMEPRQCIGRKYGEKTRISKRTDLPQKAIFT